MTLEQPFSENLARILIALQHRVWSKKASLILIDGGLGEGKTTLMVELLDYINKINGLPEIELPGPQLAVGNRSFLTKMRQCYENKLPAIGYDEAGDYSKRGALTRMNAILNRTFDTFRAFKCIVILATPNFEKLDSQLMDNKIPRLLLHLKNRNESKGYFYGYSLYRMMLLRHNIRKAIIKPNAFNRVYPNFAGSFLNLPEERCQLLDSISTGQKISILKNAEAAAEKTINAYETVLLKRKQRT